MRDPNRSRRNRGRPKTTPSRRDNLPDAARGTRWHAAVLIVAGALTYLNSLTGPVLFDDESTIFDNTRIRQLFDLSVLLPERELAVAGRPLVNVSFAVNYAIGGFNVVGYHVWNIVVHLLCALMIFAIVNRALRLPRLPAVLGEHASNLAFAVALLWVLHPLNSEVVDYLSQRTESMMALFYLLTFWASLRVSTRRMTQWHVVAVLSCALGMACKESMVTAPVIVVLFDRIFRFDSFRQAFRERWRLYAGLAATWVILAGLLATSPRPFSAGFFTGVTPWTYLLNQTEMLTRYLRLAVWPTSLVIVYGSPRAVTLGDVWPYAVFITSLLALTGVGLRWYPRLGFLGAWFFLTLAPTSSFVPIANEVGAERRMYLPLAALILLAAVAVASLWNRLKQTVPRTRVVWWAAALLVAAVPTALAAATVARNREYESALVMARLTLERYPTPLAHRVLAVELLAAGKRQEAIAHLRQAVPGDAGARYWLGIELFKDRQLEEAIAHLQAFVKQRPPPPRAQRVAAHAAMGRALASQQQWPDAVREFGELLKLDPSNRMAERLLAEALYAQERFDEAIVHFREYLKAQPGDVDALTRLGIALGITGRLDDALATLRRAVELDPTVGAAQRSLAGVLLADGDLDEAALHARQAVALQPADSESREMLARILAEQNRRDQTKSQRTE